MKTFNELKRLYGEKMMNELIKASGTENETEVAIYVDKIIKEIRSQYPKISQEELQKQYNLSEWTMYDLIHLRWMSPITVIRGY